MKVLVTGGAGFIGSNVANTLARDGAEVVVLDDLSLGIPTNLDPAVKFHRGDVRRAEDVRPLCDGADYAIHIASRSSVGMYYPLPAEALDVATTGLVRVLDAAREFGVKKVVYASTSSLYSRVPPPHRESTPIVPGSFYELGKMINEETARIYNEEWGLPSVGLRYFAVYGPNEAHKTRFANIVTQFLWAMQKGEAPVIYGDGTQTRDFTYVSDIVAGTLQAMRGEYHGVLNLGTGTATSFNDVVRLLNGALGTTIEARHVPSPIQNYVHDTLADTTLARKAIGYEPKVSLEQGVAKMVAHYAAKGLRASA